MCCLYYVGVVAVPEYPEENTEGFACLLFAQSSWSLLNFVLIYVAALGGATRSAAASVSASMFTCLCADAVPAKPLWGRLQLAILGADVGYEASSHTASSTSCKATAVHLFQWPWARASVAFPLLLVAAWAPQSRVEQVLGTSPKGTKFL